LDEDRTFYNFLFPNLKGKGRVPRKTFQSRVVRTTTTLPTTTTPPLHFQRKRMKFHHHTTTTLSNKVYDFPY
jgi:hypothetical protein